MSRPNRRRSPDRSVAVRRRVLRSMARGAFALSVTGLLLATGWWLNQALAVQSWQIHGVSKPLEVAIAEQLNSMQPLDLVQAWPSRLRSRLLSRLPDLAEVNISRHLPDKLEVTATMRMPIALWRDAHGVVQLVDGKGMPYRPLKPGEMLDLPLLRVPAGDIQDSVALLLRLKQMDNARYARLSEWASEEDGWRLNFDRGRCWLLPRGEQAAERIEQVLALMQDSRWKNGDWRIDVRAARRWFIRKSQLGGMV